MSKPIHNNRRKAARERLDAPLRAARRQAKVTLVQLVGLLGKAGVTTTAGWISRIERGGNCMCSPVLAQAIVKVFHQQKVPLTEVQVLYPDRYRAHVQDRQQASGA